MPHHFFLRSTGGLGVAVLADTAAAAEAIAAAAGFPRVGPPAYRADPDDLRAHAGAFRLVGPWAVPVRPGMTLAAAEPGERPARATPPASARAEARRRTA